MALGLRDKTREPYDLPVRRDQIVQQVARNGLLVVSDNSDRTYKILLARSLGLPADARWGQIVAAFERRPRRESTRLLAAAARRWCEQMSGLAQLWVEGIAVRPAMMVGFEAVLPELLTRVVVTWQCLQDWEIAAVAEE